MVPKLHPAPLSDSDSNAPSVDINGGPVRADFVL
jgi:hypothetical protein